MNGIIPALPLRKHLWTLLASVVVCIACSSTPTPDSSVASTAHLGVLQGWRRCTDDNCGRNFISAYSTFVFLRVDDSHQGGAPSLGVTPGRHWVEAYYSWGFGVLTGIGNWRNYGFEIDVLPGHTYRIEDAPSGCIVPASRYWVSPKTLRVLDLAPSGEREVREIKAMEYCTPSSHDSGTCRQNNDCRSGVCTLFGGTTGYGLCGELRQ